MLDWPAFTGGQGPDLSPGTAVTIGVFDGLHRGHQALISGVLRRAPLIPTALTFRQSPKAVLGKNTAGELLSLERRLSLLESLGAAVTVLIDFSQDFSKLHGKDFLALLQGPGKMRFLAVGAHFRCGSGLDCGIEEIRLLNNAAGIPTEAAEPVALGGLPVSSSRIRAAIKAGDLKEAAALLGRNVEIDVSGLPKEERKGGVFYNASSRRRIIPPPGRYPARIHGAAVRETGVFVEGGGVFVPRSGGLEDEGLWIELT